MQFQISSRGESRQKDNWVVNPLMTALLRDCLIFLKFCVLDNFRLIISWAKIQVCSTVGKHVLWPSHMWHCNKILYLYKKFWLVLTQDMFFMFWYDLFSLHFGRTYIWQREYRIQYLVDIHILFVTNSWN